MKVILWMGMAVNGMVARENNKEDNISHDTWREWLKWVDKSGCLVWGRRTYEIVKTWPKDFDLKLEFMGMAKIADSLIQLQYRV